MMFFNISGLIEVIAAVGIGFMLFGEGSGLALAGLIWSGLDLGYRKMRQGEYGDFPWLAPKKGGQVMFIPGWICGIILFIFSIMGFV